MRVAVYCRVSTEDQQDKGTIENQVEFAKKYTDLHEMEIYKIYKDDGISGTIPFEDREGGMSLLRDSAQGLFESLLIYRLDRLGRSVRITLNAIESLESKGIKIKSMTEPFETENPTGRFMINMLASVADLERSTILERMQYGAERAAKNGQWLGGIVPYGYRVKPDKHLEVNEDKMPCGYSEADIVRLIYDMIANKGNSSLVVANFLNENNIPTHYAKDNRLVQVKGKRKKHTDGIWRPTRIINLVKNTIYMGYHQYGKRTNKDRKTVDREMPSIVSPELHEKTLEQLRNNQMCSSRNTKDNAYTLRGILRCAHCGKAYVGSKYKSKIINGAVTYERYYACGGKTCSYVWAEKEKKCKAKATNAKKVEDRVWNSCYDLIKNPSIIKLGAKSEKIIDFKLELDNVNRKIGMLEKEKEKISYLYRKNFISAKEAEVQYAEIDVEKKQLIGELNVLKLKEKSVNVVIDKKEKTIATLKRYGDIVFDADNETKIEVINALVEKVVATTTFQDDKAVSVDFETIFYFA